MINRIRTGIFCLLVFAIAWFPETAVMHAQSTTEGAIAGTVVDPSDAIISGAAVTLRNIATNVTIHWSRMRRATSKRRWFRPGIYTVSISYKGFGDYKANNVAVTVGSLTELHPMLQAGTTIETVEVRGEAPVLQFESPEISETLTTSEIRNLPLNGGRWSNLTLLTPAAISDANGFGLIVFRGISPLMNNVEIDGADDNQAFFAEERGRTREGYSTSQIGIVPRRISDSSARTTGN